MTSCCNDIMIIKIEEVKKEFLYIKLILNQTNLKPGKIKTFKS